MVRFSNYSGSLTEAARAVLQPTTLEDLQALVRAHDPKAGGVLTLRASGQSLHNQALGTGVVVTLGALPHRVVLRIHDRVKASVVRNTVEVSAWTPWEVVVRATLGLEAPARWTGLWAVNRQVAAVPAGHGNVACWVGEGVGDRPPLLPCTLVSSGRITPGGSLSSDAVWRLSAVLGREAESVVWLDLLRSDGAIVRLFNPRWGLWAEAALHPGAPPAGSRADNDAWFDAVVGGFGLLGAIVAVKYVVVALDPELRAAAIRLYEPGCVEPDPHHYPEDGSLESRIGKRAIARRRTPDPRDPVWPDHPHAGPDQLGRTGADLPVSTLTWLWATDDNDKLLDTLVEHWSDHHRGRVATEDIELPATVTGDTTACFGAVFPNSQRKRLQALVGNVAYAAAPPGARPFKLWDRTYGWRNSLLILRAGLLPIAARIGEQVVYHTVFVDGMEHRPTANPIPEFAFFFEGHSVAISALDEPPRTLQQAWALPLTLDAEGRATAEARALFGSFLDAVRALCRRALWRKNAVRIQVCDVKVVPPGHALLSSSPGQPALLVTLTVENVRGYRWLFGGRGSPEAAFRELAAQFRPRGARVYLTKNIHVDPADLAAMYGPAFSRFLALKEILDPKGAWGSELLATIRGAAR